MQSRIHTVKLFSLDLFSRPDTLHLPHIGVNFNLEQQQLAKIKSKTATLEWTHLSI